MYLSPFSMTMFFVTFPRLSTGHSLPLQHLAIKSTSRSNCYSVTTSRNPIQHQQESPQDKIEKPNYRQMRNYIASTTQKVMPGSVESLSTDLEKCAEQPSHIKTVNNLSLPGSEGETREASEPVRSAMSNGKPTATVESNISPTSPTDTTRAAGGSSLANETVVTISTLIQHKADRLDKVLKQCVSWCTSMENDEDHNRQSLNARSGDIANQPSFVLGCNCLVCHMHCSTQASYQIESVHNDSDRVAFGINNSVWASLSHLHVESAIPTSPPDTVPSLSQEPQFERYNGTPLGLIVAVAMVVVVCIIFWNNCGTLLSYYSVPRAANPEEVDSGHETAGEPPYECAGRSEFPGRLSTPMEALISCEPVLPVPRSVYVHASASFTDMTAE